MSIFRRIAPLLMIAVLLATTFSFSSSSAYAGSTPTAQGAAATNINMLSTNDFAPAPVSKHWWRPAPNGVSPWSSARAFPIEYYYGERDHSDTMNAYYAVDWLIPCGTPLYPIYDEMRVESLSKPPSNINSVLLRKTIDGRDILVSYSSLQSFNNLKVGQIVRLGQVIGWSGDTYVFYFQTRRCHLRFETEEMVYDANNATPGIYNFSIPQRFCNNGPDWIKGVLYSGC